MPVTVLVIVCSALLVESRPLVFSSPLRTLTLPDVPRGPSHRERFLKRFAAGAASESRCRRKIAGKEKDQRDREENDENDGTEFEASDVFDLDEEDQQQSVAYDGDVEQSNWAEMSKEKEDIYQSKKRAKVAQAFDDGFASVVKDEDVPTASPKSDNEYQFVGVVKNGDKVKWYARKKPKSADWSVRVVRPDGAAVVRDRFIRGDVDLYAKYVNKGVVVEQPTEEEEGAGNPKLVPKIETEYSLKKRSWKTLWNFSPKAFFTDRSGSYWRQRRLKPGLYTDGDGIYESTYHYGEGRNGMRRLEGSFGNLNEYMKSTNVTQEEMVERLSKPPDLVLEY